MQPRILGSLRNALGVPALLLVLAIAAQAGPLLICHPIEIGQAKSLPWTSNNWNLSGNEKYDLKRLVPDALAILDSNTRVLVRMETLRRATLYARKNPQVAKELLSRLHARATSAETAGHPDALPGLTPDIWRNPTNNGSAKTSLIRRQESTAMPG